MFGPIKVGQVWNEWCNHVFNQDHKSIYAKYKCFHVYLNSISQFDLLLKLNISVNSIRVTIPKFPILKNENRRSFECKFPYWFETYRVYAKLGVAERRNIETALLLMICFCYMTVKYFEYNEIKFNQKASMNIE